MSAFKVIYLRNYRFHFFQAAIKENRLLMNFLGSNNTFLLLQLASDSPESLEKFFRTESARLSNPGFSKTSKLMSSFKVLI